MSNNKQQPKPENPNNQFSNTEPLTHAQRVAIVNTMSNNKQYMYMVTYSQGVWDDYVKIDVFITHDESKAQTYVDKFNTLLDKWKSYFNEIVDMENAWRAYQVWNVNGAYIDKIELR